jgi:hypothetical protein
VSPAKSYTMLPTMAPRIHSPSLVVTIHRKKAIELMPGVARHIALGIWQWQLMQASGRKSSCPNLSIVQLEQHVGQVCLIYRQLCEKKKKKIEGQVRDFSWYSVAGVFSLPKNIPDTPIAYLRFGWFHIHRSNHLLVKLLIQSPGQEVCTNPEGW